MHKFLYHSMICIFIIVPYYFFSQNSPLDSIIKKERFNLHFQTTYIYQYKPSFNALYSGTNSLLPTVENQNSITATAYLGIRLWKGASFIFDPEVAGGSGLSSALGMGGSTNGETFRVGTVSPAFYIARMYLKQTFALSSPMEYQEDEANEIQDSTPKNKIQFIIGKSSIGDIFDNNDYSNSPRTLFLNWSLMNSGAWDYAANTRGYTYNISTNISYNSMSYRLALGMLPTVANGPDLNPDISKSYSLNAEIEKRFTLGRRPAKIKFLTYLNKSAMASYDQASILLHTMPSINNVLDRARVAGKGLKYGFAINGQMAVNDFVNLFTRLSWNDGNYETWAFTEIDHSMATGVSIDGKKWHRKEDVLGIAIVANGLSNPHKNFLQQGGTGFILGDGNLNYALESIGEMYYSFKPIATTPIWITGDYQVCFNPGYNKNRGPVHFFSFRVHIEF